jgi:hypothetical protein
MVKTKILGIILVVIGIGLIISSNYISHQVTEGKKKIESGQKVVDTETWLFSQNKISKEIGKTFTKGQQKQIDEGSQMAQDYEMLSNSMKYGGIALISLGIILELFALVYTKKKNRQ